MDEDDDLADITGGAELNATLLDQNPDDRFSSVFKHGSFGRMLFKSSIGLHFYIAFLIVVVAGCELGTVLLNRFLFMTGTWRFPYPATTTFLQVSMTHVLLLGSARLTRCLQGTLSGLGLPGLVAPPRSWLKGSTPGKYSFRSASSALPLSIIFVLKLMFSTLSIAYAILPKYTLFRIYTVPTSLIGTWLIFKTTHSISTMLSSLSSVFYLSMASNQPSPLVDRLSMVLGFVSTAFVALYPILFLFAFNKLVERLAANENGHSFPTSSTVPSTERPRTADAHWYLLHNLSLLSTVMMTVIFILSGDIWHIWRNCYILDQYKLWIPVIGSILTSFGVFVATPLLIRATSPLTATFLMVPRGAFQLALLHGDMPASCWVGIFGCYLSSLWYLISRRMETGPLK